MLGRISTTLCRAAQVQYARRNLATRPRRSAQRVHAATEKRVKRHLEKTKGANQQQEQQGEEILSESGMKWGFFFSLGILPLVAFSVTVSSIPHLREQFNQSLAAITNLETTAGSSSSKSSGAIQIDSQRDKQQNKI